MKNLKTFLLSDFFLSAILAQGILFGVSPFFYNLFNPMMTQMEVFEELWWLQAIGIGMCVAVFCVCKESEEEKTEAPKMANPPPPPCKHKWFVINDIQKRTLEVRCYECDVVKNFEEKKLFDEYSNYVYELNKRNLPAIPISQWVMEIKNKDA